jgi:hypothetical protein
MPLYIKAPAISSNTGPDEMWCQRPPCKTKQYQHTTLHKYNLTSTPKEPVSSSYPNPMYIKPPISITNANISPCVMYEYQHLVCKKISRQQISKHAYNNTVLLETVFSIQSMQSGYKEYN